MKLAITKKIVDFVEAHKGNGDFRYSKNFVVKEGEECTPKEKRIIDGTELVKLMFDDGRGFLLPITVIDADIEIEKKVVEDIGKLPVFDWSEYRRETARMIMIELVRHNPSTWFPESMAQRSVELTDSLIKCLNKKS